MIVLIVKSLNELECGLESGQYWAGNSEQPKFFFTAIIAKFRDEAGLQPADNTVAVRRGHHEDAVSGCTPPCVERGSGPVSSLEHASDVTLAGGQRRALSGIRALKNFYQGGIPQTRGRKSRPACNERMLLCYVRVKECFFDLVGIAANPASIPQIGSDPRIALRVN
jgi:hypothetical protein